MLWPSRNVQDHQNRINGNQVMFSFPTDMFSNQYFRYFSQKVTLFWSKNQERLTSFAGVSWNFPKSSQLWGAVSPSSMNIFWWDRYRCKGLCLNFTMHLIRLKTDAWQKSYARWKTDGFRKIRFHIPTYSNVIVQLTQKWWKYWKIYIVHFDQKYCSYDVFSWFE